MDVVVAQTNNAMLDDNGEYEDIENEGNLVSVNKKGYRKDDINSVGFFTLFSFMYIKVF